MFVSQDNTDNTYSLIALAIFILIIWPIYLGKFICIFNKNDFSFYTYVGGLILEAIILCPISLYLDSRYEKSNNDEED